MANITNILSIPLLDGANTSFVISNNAAWTDSIYFAVPGFGPPQTISGCSLAIGNNVVTVSTTTAGLSPGMQVSGGPGVPNASYVGTILSSTTFTISDAFGNSLNATVTTPEAMLTFQPPPLDLTGIGFVSNLRRNAGSAQVWLIAQTGNGTIINGGMLGTMTFNVPGSMMRNVPAAVYVMDILAADANYTINLFPNAPATVTVGSGISDITTLTGAVHT